MKFILRSILILIAFSFNVMGQYNSDYMQYMFNGLLINPAYAGSSEALNISGMYRNQWMGLPGAPVTAILSAHSPLKNKKVNIGGILINDRFGVFNHTKASLIYAYRFKLFNGHLSFGLQAGIDSYTTDWNKINTTDVGDPNFQGQKTRNIIPEVGAGTFYHSKNFYLGFSIPNLFNTGFNYDMVGILNSGCIIKMSDNIRLKPAVLIKYLKSSPLSANVSTTFYYKEVFGIGLGYTYKTATLAYVDLKLNTQFHLGYGYTYSLNILQNYTSGSHEIMLRYIFQYKINAVSARYF